MMWITQPTGTRPEKYSVGIAHNSELYRYLVFFSELRAKLLELPFRAIMTSERILWTWSRIFIKCKWIIQKNRLALIILKTLPFSPKWSPNEYKVVAVINEKPITIFRCDAYIHNFFTNFFIKESYLNHNLSEHKVYFYAYNCKK